MSEISEEERQLAIRMAHEYAARRGGKTFRASAAASFGDDSDADVEPDYVAEARKQAEVYAVRRNADMPSQRPMRGPSEDSEAARDGYQSALEWLERKRKSAIRK